MKLDDHELETYSREVFDGRYRIAVSIPAPGYVPDADVAHLAKEIARALREIADAFDDTPIPGAKA